MCYSGDLHLGAKTPTYILTCAEVQLTSGWLALLSTKLAKYGPIGFANYEKLMATPPTTTPKKNGMHGVGFVSQI